MCTQTYVFHRSLTFLRFFSGFSFFLFLKIFIGNIAIPPVRLAREIRLFWHLMYNKFQMNVYVSYTFILSLDAQLFTGNNAVKGRK